MGIESRTRDRCNISKELNTIKEGDFAFNKGAVKQLYEYNQEVKNIFKNYYFCNAMVVTGEYAHNNPGIHYVEQFHIAIPFEYGIVYNSNDVYKATKGGRSKLTHYNITEKVISINGENIGELKSILELRVHQVDIRCKQLLDKFNKSDNIVILTGDDIFNLSKNKVLDIECREYYVRISNKLIPGFKKSHKIEIRFYESERKGIFYTDIKVNRNGIYSHHIYKCLKL